jgi:hypothetical protein
MFYSVINVLGCNIVGAMWWKRASHHLADRKQKERKKERKQGPRNKIYLRTHPS